jgi:hypothetical protein
MQYSATGLQFEKRTAEHFSNGFFAVNNLCTAQHCESAAALMSKPGHIPTVQLHVAIAAVAAGVLLQKRHSIKHIPSLLQPNNGHTRQVECRYSVQTVTCMTTDPLILILAACNRCSLELELCLPAKKL